MPKPSPGKVLALATIIPLSLKIIMKYTNYLPLIDISTSCKFVLWGGWYTENKDGTISLRNGQTCKKWETFPN